MRKVASVFGRFLGSALLPPYHHGHLKHTSVRLLIPRSDQDARKSLTLKKKLSARHLSNRRTRIPHHRDPNLPPSGPPQVRTYLLLRSILWQLAAIAEGLRPDLDDDDSTTWASGKGSGSGSISSAASSSKQLPPEKDAGSTSNDPSCWGPRDLLVAGLCTLRLLRANMYYLRAAGVSPGTVGLGTSSGNPPGARRESVVDQRSPFASGLLSLLLDYAGGVLDVLPDAEEEEDGGGEEEMDSLRRAVRYEAAEVVGQSLDIFLPEAAQKVGLLTALFHVGLGGAAGQDDDKDGERKDEGTVEETKTWGDNNDGSGRSAGGSSSDEVAIAAAAAMADGPLPVDMDEEGRAALISGVCSAICSDPNMLLSLVPEAVRPALTMRDVPSYVAATVRSAEKAQAQALQQAMLKEAASASSSGTPAAAPPSGAGGSRGSTSSPRLAVPRGRGSTGGGDPGDGFELWKSGPMVDLPRPGDVVVRGPDWAWGEQDGDAAGRGIVVGLATWGRVVESSGKGGGGGVRDGADSSSSGSGGSGSGGAAVERNAVRVMWENGTVNVYRWGAADPCDPAEQPCYDLKVLRTPSTGAAAQGEAGGGTGPSGSDGSGGKTAAGGKTKTGQVHGGGKGRSSRGELRWSVEEVEAALLPRESGGERSGGGSVHEAPTTREVLRFIKNNAPQEWREPRRITGAENALVKVTNIQDAPYTIFVFDLFS